MNHSTSLFTVPNQ